MSTSTFPLISVVDDDRSVVEGIVSLMESVGYAATGFLSARDFLESPQSRRAACLIVDVRMPDIGGLELQRRLAADDVRTPIIFITANEGGVVAEEALELGAVAFLHKPFNQESLLGAVRSVLAQQKGAE